MKVSYLGSGERADLGGGKRSDGLELCRPPCLPQPCVAEDPLVLAGALGLGTWDLKDGRWERRELLSSEPCVIATALGLARVEQEAQSDTRGETDYGRPCPSQPKVPAEAVGLSETSGAAGRRGVVPSRAMQLRDLPEGLLLLWKGLGLRPLHGGERPVAERRARTATAMVASVSL